MQSFSGTSSSGKKYCKMVAAVAMCIMYLLISLLFHFCVKADAVV